MRTIRIIGAIDENAFKKFSRQLEEVEESGEDHVHLELLSEGGEEYTGLAFYGRIVNSPVHITCTAYGCVMSAATLVFAACDYRQLDSACWFMVHDSTDQVTGVVSGISHHVRHMHAMETQWAQLLSMHSKASPELWRELSLKTSFITADELLELGLADLILNGVKT